MLRHRSGSAWSRDIMCSSFWAAVPIVPVDVLVMFGFILLRGEYIVRSSFWTAVTIVPTVVVRLQPEKEVR